MSAGSSSSSRLVTTGRRPTNSGIIPNLSRSSGSTMRQQLADVLLGLRLHVGAEAQALPADAPLDDLLEAAEGAAADEEDVRGVDLQELLLRMLAAALRRHVRDGALDDLEERLLHALAGDVARDRRVLALARDLVDLVDVDDALLRLLDVVIGGLQQVDDDVLDVLADVAGLGEAVASAMVNGTFRILRERLREQRLAGAGRAEEQDVRLLQLDVVDADARLDALVVVVDRDRERLLRALLPDHVLVEDVLDLGRARDAELLVPLLLARDLLGDDVVAQPDALVADVDGRAGDELLHLFLRLPAEAAAEGFTLLQGRLLACPGGPPRPLHSSLLRLLQLCCRGRPVAM